jgi:hypothetical protein
MPNTLDKILDLTSASPHSADALSLYALMSTLNIEQSGCLFRLLKFREMSEAARSLAYELLEMAARGENSGDEWDNTLKGIEKAMRG